MVGGGVQGGCPDVLVTSGLCGVGKNCFTHFQGRGYEFFQRETAV